MERHCELRKLPLASWWVVEAQSGKEDLAPPAVTGRMKSSGRDGDSGETTSA
jgi:hypothetical protein